jgi:hypothetical protein
MKKSEKMEVGDVVYLKSDVSGEYPMTIVESLPPDDDEYLPRWQVCWLTKSGHTKYSGFPEKALRKSQNIE